MKLDAHYWQNRYENNDAGWDLGDISPPLREYFDRLTDLNLRILIPGCGKAYEAEYLHRKGFKNVVVLDYAPLALQAFSARVPDFPREHLLVHDFFTLTGTYDLIVEQTFFCALDRSLRTAYAAKMNELLSSDGVLAGVLFNDFETNTEPPFGGSEKEYRLLLEPVFTSVVMQDCKNSIKPRMGRELFFVCRKTIKNP